MADYKSLFMNHLDQRGTMYENISENAVKITWEGENLKTIPIYVIFDEDGNNYIQLDCWNIVNFSKEKMAAGLIVCNSLNRSYRWVKFYIDDELDVRCQADMIVEPETVGEECREYVIRMMNIIDDAYPEILKALWA